MVTNRIVILMSWALVIGPLAAQPGGPGPAPATPAPAPDPLLSEDWRAAESLRARGLASRVSRLLEKPGGGVVIRDKDNRRFRVEFSGRISFNPRDDNWKKVVPRLSQANLHLAEARALYKIGARREAIFLWKAVIAMARYSPGARAFVRRTAEKAAIDLNRAGRYASNFEELDRRTEPYVYYDDNREETLLLSDTYGVRARLPGLWRFKAGEDPFSRPGDLKENISLLKRGNLLLRVGIDSFSRAYRVPVVPGYLSLWDYRRSLSRSRMIMFRFRRRFHPANRTYCRGGGLPTEKKRQDAYPRVRRAGNRRFARVRDCMVLESSLFAPGRRPVDRLVYRFNNKDKDPPAGRTGRRFNFIEFYLLRRFRGFYLELRHETAEKRIADEAMDGILKNLLISSD